MKIKNLLVPLLTITNLLFFTGCPDNGVQPPTNPLQITIEDATCTEAFLKISLAADEQNRTVTLKRGDSTIFSDLRLQTSDTLVIDDGLLPNKTYTYSMTTGSWKVTVQATTQDTTSHQVQWQLPDTLGAQGLIRDVWVFSKTDAWAVGEIFLRDSNGNIDNGTRYNASHWDGVKWTLMRIPYYYQGHQVYNPLYSIFAFGENDIWFGGNGVIHWNGQQYIPAEIPSTVWGAFTINKLWGTSSNNLFLVGENGSIAQYANGTWTKMESHTTVDLWDIWGIDDTHVWATGLNSRDGHSVVLQYNGKQWTTLYDSDTQPFQTKYQFSRVWTDNPSRIYLDGGSGLHIMNLNNFIISSQINTGQTYISYCLRGTRQNDIFDGGPAGEFSHGNGFSWYLYPEFKTLNDGDAWFTSVHPTKDFIVIGGLYLTALNGFPVVVRGYR
jgi:hypothetical protein